MSLKELMGSLQTFELNLKMTKKEKSITLQDKKHESSDEGNVSDDESMVLLTQSFNRYLKRMNKKKFSQGSGKMNQVQRNKNTTNLVENKKSDKGIQFRESEGFDHIQSECANTLKKKEKSLKTTWSDNESDDSEDDDNNVSNYVVLNSTT